MNHRNKSEQNSILCSRARSQPRSLRAIGRSFAFAAALVVVSFTSPAHLLFRVSTIDQPASAQPASAQPAQQLSDSHQAIPSTAAEALRRLTFSYRSGPIAERLTFTLDDEPLRADLDRSVLVRVFTGVSPTRLDRIVRIDLPDLGVYAVARRVVATRPSDPSRFIEWSIDGSPTLAVLESILPPLAIPQLAFALGDDTIARPTPFGTVDSWALKAPAQPDQSTLVRLVGTGATTITELVFDAVTDRLTEFTIRPAPGRPGTTVHARCETIAPGLVKSWTLSVEGRRRAQTFDELHTPPSELRVGDVLPEMSFQDRQQTRWSLSDSFASAKDTDLGLMLLFRPTPAGDAAITRDVAAGLHAMQQVWRRSVLRSAERQSEPVGRETPDSKLLFARGVAVFDLEVFTRDRLERLHGTWAASVTAATSTPKPDVRPPPDVASLLWTPTGASSLDRLAPDVLAVLLVIGADRTIRALVRLDGRASDEAALNAELETAVQ